MAWEYHKVEVAWASQPDATFPIWTDETSRVDPDVDIVITRGRQNERDSIDPSTLSLAFNNADHRFTPGNPYSPLYPNVKPARKIRVSETIDGITYYLFTGYIQFPDISAWAQAAPGAKFDQLIVITAVDRMGRLDRYPAFKGLLAAHIQASADLVSYYPLDDTGLLWRDAVGGQPAFTPGTTRFGAPSIITPAAPTIAPADDGRSMLIAPVFDSINGFPITFGQSQSSTISLTTPTATTNGSISLSYWCTRTTDNQNSAWPVGSFTSTPTITLKASLEESQDSNGNMLFTVFGQLYDGTSTYNTPTATPTFAAAPATGQPQLVTLRITMPSKLFEVWLNDAVIYSATLTGSGTLNTAALGRLDVGTGPWAGAVQHIQIRNGSTWAFADHLAEYQLGIYGLVRQTPGQRIATVLGYAGVSAADMRLDGGTSIMASPAMAGRHPTDPARDAAATDAGLLFTSGDGAIVFHARDRRYNPPIAATIDLSWLSGTWQQRMQPPINVAAITGGNGTTVTTTNVASELEYGAYPPTGTVTIQSAIDVDPDNLGAWLTTFYAAPAMRAPAMTIDLIAKSNTIRHTILGREISDRIAMSGLPSNAPEGIGAQFVEGVQHRISTRRRTVTLNTSPLVGYLPGTTPTWPVCGLATVGPTTVVPY